MNPLLAHVSEYMTAGPYAVGPNEPLANASRLMRERAIRHLPVWAGGRLVGIVSERDIQLLQALRPAPDDALTVAQAMTAEPYAPSADALLAEVVRTMTERKMDSAVVLDGGRIVGIFTAIDAMRALLDALEGRLAGSLAEARPTHARRASARRRATTR